jgi:DNA-binding beta-propeller fold protein YncE
MYPKGISLGRAATTAIASVVLVAGLGLGTAWAQSAAGKWTTSWAEKLGVTLEKTFDSSGPDAWDPKKHPLVFVTSEGPGYGGLLSGVKLPGVAIFDGDTRKVVASQAYDVLAMGWKNVFEPHGLGVSSDGKWIYVPTGEGSFRTRGAGRLLIVNARTLKLDKMLKLNGNAHHIKAFHDADGKPLVLVESFGDNAQPTFILDPRDDNKVVGGWTFEELGMGSYLNFVAPDGREIFVGGRPKRPKVADRSGNPFHETTVVRIDTRTWKKKGTITIGDSSVIWTAFSADNRWAYFSGGHESQVFKYDRRNDKVVAYARAGVEGPYGIHLGWKDEVIYAIGKGEGSHNRGKVLGLVNTKLMDKPGGDRPMDQIYTGCIRGDHGTTHPNPEANELWITCNSSFEVVVFDMDQRQVTARLKMPHGGSTHSGAFVQYRGWQGEVVSDQNGLQGSALAKKRQLLGLPVRQKAER